MRIDVNTIGQIRHNTYQVSVKFTKQFTYFGSKVSGNGDSSSEINARIGKAGAAIGQIRHIMSDESLSLKTKIDITR